MMKMPCEEGQQPCQEFQPGESGDPGGSYNHHECPGCDGDRRFCQNCLRDHHSGGWETCRRLKRAHAREAYEGLCMSDDREAWLEARRSGLGASEIAGVLEESPWSSPLSVYQDKVAPEPDEDQERLFWGRHLEQRIGEGYAIRTGRRFKPAGRLLRSVAHPWALATLDGWTSEDGATWWPCEIKNVNEYMVEHWQNGPPRHVYLQAQHQMLVTGYDRVTVVGLLGGCQLAWADIERDEVCESCEGELEAEDNRAHARGGA